MNETLDIDCARRRSLNGLLVDRACRSPFTSKEALHVSRHRARHAAHSHGPRRASASTEKVNINTADAKALASLNGVSRSLAEKIVKYRDEHGPFRKTEDLRRVDGVGNGVLEKNRERITVK